MADTPIINGHTYSWASIEFGFDGVSQPDLTEITYDVTMDPGLARGTGSRVRGDTAGEADSEGSFTMLKGEAAKFIAKMGKGLMRKRFPITVSYDEDGEGGVVTDELIGVRIKKIGNNPTQGTDPAKVTFDIHIMRMNLNGVDVVGDASR